MMECRRRKAAEERKPRALHRYPNLTSAVPGGSPGFPACRAPGFQMLYTEDWYG